MSDKINVNLNINEITRILTNHMLLLYPGHKIDSLKFNWHFPVFGDGNNFSVTITEESLKEEKVNDTN